MKDISAADWYPCRWHRSQHCVTELLGFRCLRGRPPIFSQENSSPLLLVGPSSMRMFCSARSTTRHCPNSSLTGWPEFRKKELELPQYLLETKRTGHIISLGGGVLETLQCRDLLKAYVREGGSVVRIIHDIDEICAYLGEEQARPTWGEPFEDIVKR